MTQLMRKLPITYIYTFLYIGLLEMTQLTRKLPIALRLILRGFPGTDGLMSPPGKPSTQF